MKPCCTPAGRAGAGAPDTSDAPRVAAHDATLHRACDAARHAASDRPLRPALRPLPGGRFLMGTDADDGFAADGEGPVREVRVGDFQIAPHAVTNADFRAFVRATGYVTEAERVGASFVFYLQVPADRRRDIRRVARDLPWWLPLEGACWQRPGGPGTGIHDRLDHPVVHVSWHDAAAYCDWSGTRLPTEAQWEYAARGGLAQARYPWGDVLEPDGTPCCNIWRGEFPSRPAEGWTPDTVPVDRFAPNGHGLYNMAGNAWEWCADWFAPDYHRVTQARDPLQSRATGRRSQRGGSFLCHASYCNRYRVAARGANTPGSSSSNCGFRVAAPLDV